MKPRMREQMRLGTQRRRHGVFMTTLAWTAGLVALLPLVLILTHLIVHGLGQITPTFLTSVPAPPGVRGGGVANGIVGSALLVIIALGIAVPVGIGAGLYLAEHGATRFARLVRLLADVLGGLPSIVMGIVAWELIVRPAGHFSAWAGGVALGLLVIPLVTRATEEMVRLVPSSLAEAALALGYPQWRTALTIVLRTAMPGVVTSIFIALARVAGETAPLLFTAFGNPFWSVDPSRPIAALPLQIYAYAQSPYEEWRGHAWAGALLLLVLVAGIGLGSRAVLRARARLFATVRSTRASDG